MTGKFMELRSLMYLKRHNRNTLLQALILGMLLFSLPALTGATVRVQGLYEIEIVVKNQSPAERKRALRKGLADIFTRLTGSQALERFGQMLSVLDRAPRYVEQYRYRKEQITDEIGQETERWLLWVRFNRKTIEKIIRDQELPLWGSTRPETLVWLAVEQADGTRYILGNDETNPLFRALLQNARRRAVPVLVPLMDLDDQRKVKMGDVWGGFSGQIKTASARYATENILIGRVYPVGQGWESRWTLVTREGERSWAGAGRQVDQAIAQGLDGLGDLMAARYALKGQQNISRYQLSISNVKTAQDYVRTSQYLSSISMISSFQPVSFSQGQVVYEIDLRSNLAGLEQLLAIEQKLLPEVAANNEAPVITPPGQVNLTQEIRYRLKP